MMKNIFRGYFSHILGESIFSSFKDISKVFFFLSYISKSCLASLSGFQIKEIIVIMVRGLFLRGFLKMITQSLNCELAQTFFFVSDCGVHRIDLHVSFMRYITSSLLFLLLAIASEW